MKTPQKHCWDMIYLHTEENEKTKAEINKTQAFLKKIKNIIKV